MSDLCFTVRETAELIGCGLNACYEAIHNKEIPSVRIGGRWFVPRGALMRMLDSAATTATVK